MSNCIPLTWGSLSTKGPGSLSICKHCEETKCKFQILSSHWSLKVTQVNQLIQWGGCLPGFIQGIYIDQEGSPTGRPLGILVQRDNIGRIAPLTSFFINTLVWSTYSRIGYYCQDLLYFILVQNEVHIQTVWGHYPTARQKEYCGHFLVWLILTVTTSSCLWMYASPVSVPPHRNVFHCASVVDSHHKTSDW